MKKNKCSEELVELWTNPKYFNIQVSSSSSSYSYYSCSSQYLNCYDHSSSTHALFHQHNNKPTTTTRQEQQGKAPKLAQIATCSISPCNNNNNSNNLIINQSLLSLSPMLIVSYFLVVFSFLSSSSLSHSHPIVASHHHHHNHNHNHNHHHHNHSKVNNNQTTTTTTFRPYKELHKLRRAKAYLKTINKPYVKTIQSPDGDVIDCVASHVQPAFDHPELKGQRPLDPPERPKGKREVIEEESVQLWSERGESCPEGTIPIRRTTESDILRANSIAKFGRKPVARHVRRDSSGSGHEHAVVFVNGDQYYGAKASLNVWSPRVTEQYEFSLSQIWVISGSFGNDLNTIEAGWQVSPELYGDNYPRFFTYWTTDAYQATGCYNLLCSGFVQTNNKIAIGAAISPRSSVNGKQYDIGLMVWKDPKHGNWWLEYGNGLLVGYWPAFLFSHLRSHASMIQFGGEIVNSRSSGYHTSTQMGSGHFADEGFGKASYFRNLQVVDWDNNLLPLENLHLLADHSNCYDIRQGKNGVWGTYFYYGGPGRNVRCP